MLYGHLVSYLHILLAKLIPIRLYSKRFIIELEGNTHKLWLNGIFWGDDYLRNRTHHLGDHVLIKSVIKIKIIGKFDMIVLNNCVLHTFVII